MILSKGQDAARVLAVALQMFAAIFLVAGCVELGKLRKSKFVDIPLTQAHLWVDAGGIRGQMLEGLPPYIVRWNGEPPRATIVDPVANTTVASQALSGYTFELNQDVVHWVPADDYKLEVERCEFKLSRVGLSGAAGMLLRLERCGSRARAMWLMGTGAALLGISFLILIVGRLTRLHPWERPAYLMRVGKHAAFATVAFTALVLMIPASPWLTGDTDAASINSFAAALDSPAVFERDKLLSDPTNFRWYTPLYVNAARVARVVGLPYDAGRVLIAFITTWLGLLGYDRLFGMISRSSAVGFLGALSVTLLHAGYPPNEHWAFPLALPRGAFAGLLPWVLILMIKVRRQPARWWLAAAASAGLFYVHPVSAPALTAAVLSGLFLAGEAQSWRRVGSALAATAASAVVMLPYGLMLLRARLPAAGNDALACSSEVLRSFLVGFSPPEFLTSLGAMLLGTPRYWVFALILIGLAFSVRRHWEARFLLSALLGYALMMSLVPAVDWELAKHQGRLPLQIDLLRNARYLDVIVVAEFALLARLLNGGEGQRARWRLTLAWGRRSVMRGRGWVPRSAVLACVLLVLCYAVPMARSFFSGARSVDTNIRTLRGRPPDVPRARLEVLRAVNALRRPEEIVFVPFDLDFFRQEGVPLAYTWKDPWPLAYVGAGRMCAALRVSQAADLLLQPEVDRAAATSLAKVSEAELLVIEAWRAAPALHASGACVFRNERYLVLSMRQPASPEV